MKKNYHPVQLNVFPIDETVNVFSLIPGIVEILSNLLLS